MLICYNYVKKDIRDSKKQKKWMLQHAAAYVQDLILMWIFGYFILTNFVALFIEMRGRI